MNADVLLRLARALSPAPVRARRFEEWQADLAGAAELGISPAGVLSGAVRFAIQARAARMGAWVLGLLVRSSTPVVGLLVGAACAVTDVPVLVVALLAVLPHACVFAVSRSRARTRRLLARRLETGR